MTPWRLAQGEKLYRDIHFPHGPLGPYLGAASDGILGRSLPARIALAAVVAFLHLAALDRLSRRVLPPGRAALATSAAVASAMFLRPGGWLFPFSLDTAIAVTALTWACVLHDRADSEGRGGGAGLCLAAALLARPEMGVAAVAVFAFAARREPLRLLRLAVFPLAAAAVAYGALSVGLGRESLVADGWLRFLDPPEAYRNVYRSYAGLDRIGLRVAELLLAALVLALCAALLAVAAFFASRAGSGSRTAGLLELLGQGILGAAAVARFHPPESLAETLDLFPPLVRVIPPLVALAGGLRFLVRLRRRQPRGLLAAVPDTTVWIAALFSLRLFLAAGYVGPYAAFFLPLPLVVAFAAVFALADRAAPALGRALPRLTAAALWVFVLFRAASLAQLYRGRAWSRVDTPVGSLRLTEPAASATRAALEDLARRLPGRGTLAGFPETGFYNYALGRRSPFWLDQFFPGHLDESGETRAIGVLESRPPDALLYANVLAAGEGARVFGLDYNERLDAAARARYRTAALYGPGAMPRARIGDPGFFVEILVPRGNGP